MLLKGNTKKYVDKNKVGASYFITCACFLLIACNVGVFVFTPKMVAPLTIVLSNAITIVLMLLALRPINNLLQAEFAKKADELMARERDEKLLREKVVELETMNSELERRIDVWSQTSSTPPVVKLSFKVETMTFDKSGYIVSEEPLSRFMEDPSYKLADKTGMKDRFSKWMDSLSHQGERKVLYIGKYYIKASIGIDFTRIKFSVRDGILTFSGVRFTKLNDLAINRDGNDVNHCWLLNEKGDETTINHSAFYREFTEAYSRLMEKDADMALEQELEILCERYTEVFRANLTDRFPGIEFCDSIEESSDTWYSLKDHIQDPRVLPIVSNMLLMADVLSGTTDFQNRRLCINR